MTCNKCNEMVCECPKPKKVEYDDVSKYLNKIICADSLEIMRKLPDKSIDLCLCDPPYGIGEAGNDNASRGKGRGGLKNNALGYSRDYGNEDWDNEIPDKEYFDEIFRISKNQIIFGGNYFVEYLKNSSCWLVWDKDNGNNDFADCELVWTSLKPAVRKIKYKWQGMLQENMKHKEKRVHPTQKPLDVFIWILNNYSEKGMTVLDPFAGSCVTAQACSELGRDYICIEKIQKYVDYGNSRLSQTVLFN